MNTAARSKSRTARKSLQKTGTKSKGKKSKDFTTEYTKYFVAPAATPDTFRILDLTEGASISYSSHT